MRFSSVFQSAPVPPQAARSREAAPADEAAPQSTPSTPPPELPDDLDARVRLIGEWQLGEAY